MLNVDCCVVCGRQARGRCVSSSNLNQPRSVLAGGPLSLFTSPFTIEMMNNFIILDVLLVSDASWLSTDCGPPLRSEET
jgi:hypothetical protein